ncbi:hypothetical protein ACLI4Z_11700 [Natrialbaceae archaeon A-arb3/5]
MGSDSSAVYDPFVDENSLPESPNEDENKGGKEGESEALTALTKRHRVATDSTIERIQNGHSVSSYHHASLFGLLPTYHPDQHPVATGSDIPQTGGGSELSIDPDELEDRVETGDWEELTGSHNPLWSLKLTDLGFKEGERGKNPFGHHGKSENYFKVFDDNKAYCFKNDVLYNFLTAVLCEIGERQHTHAEGSLSEREKFLVWKYARKQGLVPDHTPLPLKSLIWYALDNEIATEDELEPWDIFEDDEGETSGENSSDSGSNSSVYTMKLPTEKYKRTLRHIRDVHDVRPARLNDPKSTGEFEGSTSGSSSGSQAGSSSDGTGSNEGTDPDSDEAVSETSDDHQDSEESESISWEDARRTFGNQYRYDDDAPEDLEQFMNIYVTVDEDVDDPTDSDLAVPAKDFRAAYYTWIDLVKENHSQNETGFDGDLEKPAASVLGRDINGLDRIANKQRRIDGNPKQCYLGIELNEDGKDLVHLSSVQDD